MQSSLKYIQRTILVLLILPCVVNISQAQDPRIGGSQGGNSFDTQPVISKETPDIKYYHLEDRNIIYPLKDTSLNDFDTYAPHRRFETAAFNLGNLGSSAYQMSFKTRNDVFRRIGYTQYDIYKIYLEDIAFYTLNRPYNDLYFSPQGGQQNFQVGARFSRDFENGINISLDYTRINQEGFYQDQQTKTTSFALAFSKRSDKHEVYLTFMANNFNESFNGGVPENIDSVYTDPVFRDQRSSIPVYLDDANGRHQYFSYSVDNFWKNKNNLGIHHHARLEHGYFRYSDTGSSTKNDSLSYLSYLTDDRGVRVVNKFKRLTQKLTLFRTAANSNLEFGFSYRLLDFDYGPLQEQFHETAASLKAAWSPGKSIELNSELQIGLGDNTGNYNAKLMLAVSPSKKFQLNLGVQANRFDEYLIQDMFFVTQKQVFNNDFSKISEYTAEAKLKYNPWNLSLEALAGQLNSPVYYDQSALPRQFDGNLSLVIFKIKHHLSWKWGGFENALLYQKFSDNVFVLPNVYSYHNFYLKSRFFKKRLRTRMGIQYYHIDTDESPSFMPANGSFYPSGEKQEYFPISDLYITMQVDQFRVFIRYDNFTDLFRKEVHYLVNDYPQFDAKLRMGVRWIFYD